MESGKLGKVTQEYLAVSPLDEEREIQGQGHQRLQNQEEDAVSLWWVADLDLG